MNNRTPKHNERCPECGQRVGLALTRTDVLRIKQLIAEGGITLTRIAQHYGVTLQAISRIKRGINWKHTKETP